MVENKIKVLVIPSDRYGVGYYRSINPHSKLEKLYPEDFSVTIDFEPEIENIDYWKQFDIVHFHKRITPEYSNTIAILKVLKQNNIISVMDIDDYWDLGIYHSNNLMHKKHNIKEKIIENLKNVDYVTTTTEIFANSIKKFNKNVFVIPNSIDKSEKQFINQDIKSKRLRFGLIMGSQHEHDVNLLKGMINKLKNYGVLDKIQIVLCGFDTRGEVTEYQKDGTIKKRKILPQETVWSRYEKVLTDDYSICSEDYKKFLSLYKPNSEYNDIENEPYRRCWTKEVNQYATHYNNIDVLLAPLKETDFNKHKSQLKAIEAGMMGKAIIAQNFGPYKLDLNSYIEKFGVINHNGNALLVDSLRNHKDWADYIKKLVNDREMLNTITKNLNKTITEKYSIEVVSKIRSDFYKEIINK